MSQPVYKSIHTYLEQDYEKFAGYDRIRFMLEKMKPALSRSTSFLDVGCAKGEMIYCILKEHANVKCVGVDPSLELLERARSFPPLKETTFLEGQILDLSFENEFDLCLASGVVTIFDDLKDPLLALLKVVKPGGRVFVFSGFNSHDMDVIVRHRNNAIGSTTWESGLNMFSLKTVEKLIEEQVESFRWHPFDLSLDLSPQENPIKSYTLNTKEKGRVILNGANIIREFYLLEMVKKEN